MEGLSVVDSLTSTVADFTTRGGPTGPSDDRYGRFPRYGRSWPNWVGQLIGSNRSLWPERERSVQPR